MSIYEQLARTWNDGVRGFGRHSYSDAISWLHARADRGVRSGPASWSARSRHDRCSAAGVLKGESLGVVLLVMITRESSMVSITRSVDTPIRSLVSIIESTITRFKSTI